MKSLRTLLVVFVLSLGFVSANAQGFNWGVKAGLNVSSLTSSDIYDYRAGFHGGLIGQYMFSGSEGFGIESGLQYSLLGAKAKILNISETLAASYLQLPIQAIYKFNVGQDLYLYPAAGIYLGYGIGGTDDYFDVAENFDLGLKVGLNLQYDRFLIGAGYEYGFTKVYKNLDPKNSNVSVSVGYLF